MKASLSKTERGFLVFRGCMDLGRLLSKPIGIPFRANALSPHVQIRSPIRGIGLKLLLIVFGVSLFGVITSSALILTLQRQELIDSTQSSVTHLGNAIAASLEQAMLRNDRVALNQMIQTIAGKGNGEQIRILDKQAVVQASSIPAEIENRLNRTDATCQFCHADQVQPANRTTILTSQGGRSVLLNVHVITNSPQCIGCHGAESQVLGVMMIEMPLSDLNNQLTAAFWRIGMSAVLTITLLVGLLSLGLKRLVLLPVDELTRGMSEIRAGNLDAAVRAPSGDELGDLAIAFDTMRQQLKSSRAEMEHRTRELAILNELALGTSELLNLQRILDLALDIVVNRLGMQAGIVYLLDSSTGRYVQRACRGISQGQCQDIERRRERPGGDLSHLTAKTGQEIFVANMAADDRFQGLWDELERRSYVNVPLKSRGAVVGTLGLVSHAGQELTDREVQVLKAVGHQVGTAIDNASLLAETQRREQETVTLYRLMMQISSSLELDHVLEAIAEGARQVLDADIGAVGLVEEGQSQVSVRACVGNTMDLWRGLSIPIKSMFASGAPLTGPIVIEEWTSDLPIPCIEQLIDQEGVVSSLAAPMWSRGRLYGFVGIMTRQRRRFLRAESQLFVRFVLQVQVAIENADLYRQVRYMATLEERDRLARELHDNLAQMLGAMNIKASITKHHLARNQIEDAFSSLLELERVTNQAYTDVREAIFSLRTFQPSEWELVPTLREYLTDYRKHYGIDVQLVAEEEMPVGLGGEAQVQVVRIIQEALTNVRKHSGARRAWVRFAQDKAFVQISMEDDGQGFDPDRVAAEHFGLQIMRERAESIGGTLRVNSEKGMGTRVLLQVPFACVQRG